MAVYSHITKNELINILKQYNIGTLKKFEGILEGIENTNYKITTSRDIYILTIFEKRVNLKELPFFINLKNHLAKKNFLSPKPITSNKGRQINKLKNKSCVLISYLSGAKTKKVTLKQCEQVGYLLSSFHEQTKDFKEKRLNGMNYIEWKKIFLKCQTSHKKNNKIIFNAIKDELLFLKDNWPKKLPIGIVHADVFQDNVFFINNKFSGLIDFYFSCNDFLAYDIALAINAWCFDKQNKFNKKKFKSLINGYQLLRLLTLKEKKSFSILLRGAAIRILITRVHDKLFHPKGAFVEPKDPNEYLSILKFHQNNNILRDL